MSSHSTYTARALSPLNAKRSAYAAESPTSVLRGSALHLCRGVKQIAKTGVVKDPKRQNDERPITLQVPPPRSYPKRRQAPSSAISRGVKTNPFKTRRQFLSHPPSSGRSILSLIIMFRCRATNVTQNTSAVRRHRLVERARPKPPQPPPPPRPNGRPLRSTRQRAHSTRCASAQSVSEIIQFVVCVGTTVDRQLATLTGTRRIDGVDERRRRLRQSSSGGSLMIEHGTATTAPSAAMFPPFSKRLRI
jgi:hypothetical protein